MRQTSPLSGDHYRSGGTRAVCDECGLVYRMTELRKRWDGAMVCGKDWETRHPQELIRGVSDHMAVENARPETFRFLVNNDCSSATGWIIGVGWSINTETHEIKHASGTTALTLAISGLANGLEYDVMVLCEGRTLGAFSITCATGSILSAEDPTGQSNAVVTAGGTTDSLIITPTDSFDGSIKLVTVSIK